MGLAGTRLSTGTIEGVESLLLDAQRTLDEAPQRMVVVDHEAFRRLPADVAVHRAGLALMHGDVDDTVVFARSAMDLALDDDLLARGAASALIGLAAWRHGDLETASTSYAESVRLFEQIGHIADVLGCSITLADLQLTSGGLRAAIATFDHALRLAAGQEGAVLRGTADMHVGRSALLYEIDDLDAARQRARAVRRARRARRAAAERLSQPGGDGQGWPRPTAIWTRRPSFLDEAERVYVGDFSPEVRPVPALRARVWLAQGRLADALRWVDQQELSATDDLSYLREFEHITLARVLIDRGEPRSGSRPPGAPCPTQRRRAAGPAR